MKTKINGILTLLLAFMVQMTFAQERTVSGVVTDEMGPIADISVKVKGTTKGTVTDFDGNYTIKANTGDTLVFTHVSYAAVSKVIGVSSKIDVIMKESGESLKEVVITAMGIRKEKKALGYAVSVVKGDQLHNRPEADIARVLGGKVSGISVIGTGGLTGSGTNINVRTNMSINGNNQPLFIVNGVPFSSDTNQGGRSTGNGGSSTSSRFLDLDPNTIVSTSVLKGLSATVIYGNAGRNGVILITTKGGADQNVNKGFEISLSQSAFINSISNLPDYQNTYGQGGDNALNLGYVGNWGGRLDAGTIVRHHYDQASFANSFPQFQGVEVPYKAFKNNVQDFFRNGFGKTLSLNASKSTENSSFNINVGRTNEDGFVPGNNFKRTTFGLGGSMNLSNNFSFNGSFNFTNSEFITPPVSASNGSGFSIFERTLYIPRNLDLNGLPFQDPLTGESVYYRTDIENPLWLVNNSQEANNVNRFFNNINTVYKINDNYSLTYRVGLDTYNEQQQFYINKGGVTDDLSTFGYLKTTSLVNTIWDHSFLFGLNNIKLSEKFNLNGTLGLTTNRETYTQTGIASTKQVVFDFISHNNFEEQSNTDPLGGELNFQGERNTIGAFGQFNIDYSDYLFLTLAGRNDWSSTLEDANNSLFYPSASLAFLPTTVFSNMKTNTFNFLKLRVGYGTSAGFPPSYRTRAVLAAQTAVFTDRFGNSINTNSNNFLFPNNNLKPELHSELEFGIETKLFNNRVNLEASYYTRDSRDQILRKSLDPSTGFSSTYVNAGKILGQGIEIDLGIDILKKDDLQWNTNFLFDTSKNKVVDLPGGNDIAIAGFSNLGNYVIEGEPMGVIKGSFAVRDSEGNLMINPSTGNIISSSDVGLDDKIIGDPNPEWRISNANTISYKGISLTTQFEYTHGGDIVSSTIENQLRRGVTTDTEDREGSYIIPGYFADPATGQVIFDSNGDKISNTIQQGLNEIYFINYVDVSDAMVFDASVFRLREVSIGYELPRKFLNKTPIGSINFSLFGQNLWFLAPNVPSGSNFDPEVISTGVGNGRGLDFQTTPTSKKYGFNLRITF